MFALNNVDSTALSLIPFNKIFSKKSKASPKWFEKRKVGRGIKSHCFLLGRMRKLVKNEKPKIHDSEI